MNSSGNMDPISKHDELSNIIKLLSGKHGVVDARKCIEKDQVEKRKGAQSLSEPLNEISLEFSHVLTQPVYSALLCLCDLSYAYAHLYRDTTDEDKDAQTFLKNAAELKLKKFSFNFDWTTIYGYTGSEDQTKDATCVLCWSEDRSIIIVAFHGSISETMWQYFDKTGDWGSNFHCQPIKAGEICELRDEMPEDIEFHGGFIKNYGSVHRELTEKIKALLKQNVPNGRTSWVILTGHSKGGAMATIAAAAVKNFLSTRTMLSVQCGVVAFSSPRAIHGDRSQAWVHEILGQSNILRINVDYDVVPLLPTDWGLHFRHVGVCKIDELNDVFERIKNLYRVDLKIWWKFFDVRNWAVLHYGDAYRTSVKKLRFDSDIVLPFECIKKPSIVNTLTAQYYMTF